MSPLLNLSSNLPTRICHLFAIRTLADIPTLRGTRKRDPQNKLLELGCSNIYQQSYSLFSVGKWNSGVGGYLVLQRHVITKSSPARKGVKCKCEQSTHRAKKTESTGSWLWTLPSIPQALSLSWIFNSNDQIQALYRFSYCRLGFLLFVPLPHIHTFIWQKKSQTKKPVKKCWQRVKEM